MHVAAESITPPIEYKSVTLVKEFNSATLPTVHMLSPIMALPPWMRALAPCCQQLNYSNQRHYSYHRQRMTTSHYTKRNASLTPTPFPPLSHTHTRTHTLTILSPTKNLTIMHTIREHLTGALFQNRYLSGAIVYK